MNSRINNYQYSSLFENSIDGIYRSTVDGKYLDANTALIGMLGYDTKEELLSIDIKKDLYKNPDDRPPTDKRDRVFETQLKKKNGEVIWVQISSKVCLDEDNQVYYEGIVRDITENKKNLDKIKYLSFHDNLTGLYNRAYFEEELKRLNTKRSLPISIVFGDLNGLKNINDTFGHKEGDKLLCKVSKILKKCFRTEDIIARWGGDEFIIILTKTGISEAIKMINRIKKKCAESMFHSKPISISLGISTKDRCSKNIDRIIKQAETKMYEAKFLSRSLR